MLVLSCSGAYPSSRLVLDRLFHKKLRREGGKHEKGKQTARTNHSRRIEPNEGEATLAPVWLMPCWCVDAVGP